MKPRLHGPIYSDGRGDESEGSVRRFPRRTWVVASALLAIHVSGVLAQTIAPPAAPNPLLVESTLPYHLPPFDRIRNSDFQPAFEQGMAENLQEVETIANNPAAPTFDNTIVALERAGRLLARVDRTFSSLAGANTNPEIQALERTLAPVLAAHADKIHLNGPLFARVDALYKKRDTLGLDPESKRLVERYHQNFVRAGAQLSAADQTKLRALNGQLATLQTTFAQNVQKESNASPLVVTDRAKLAGLSDAQISVAANAATAANKPGAYMIPLLNTSGQPALSALEKRGVRERLQQLSVNRTSHGGEYDNRDVVLRLVRLRAERANLLGFPTHAAYILDDQTAKNVATVNQLLAQLAPPAVANARREAAAMQAVVNEENDGFRIAAWDWDFYAEKVRRARYDFDEEQLRPYFELNHVLHDGVFFAANRLYGITFVERPDLPVYEPTVRVFEVFDADKQPLGLFIADYYARPAKRGGAWMNAYVTQSKLFHQQAVVANHLNIPHPPQGQPTLLTFDQVRTMFHEFGHALHGLFSNVQYPLFSGTAVPRDFVEYPSQVNEMWAVWPEVLKNYAKHYKTGEPMPSVLLDKMLAARKFNQGFMTTEYLAATLLDQAWHQLTPDKIPTDALAFEAQALHEAGVDFPPVPPRYRTTYFSHVFSGGYSAGYYSYIWAEVLDADSVEWFKKHGGLKRENGDIFRAKLLSRGGSADPMSLFRDVTGGDPYIQPLLERRGLAPVADARTK